MIYRKNIDQSGPLTLGQGSGNSSTRIRRIWRDESLHTDTMRGKSRYGKGKGQGQQVRIGVIMVNACVARIAHRQNIHPPTLGWFADQKSKHITAPLVPRPPFAQTYLGNNDSSGSKAGAPGPESRLSRICCGTRESTCICQRQMSTTFAHPRRRSISCCMRKPPDT